MAEAREVLILTSVNCNIYKVTLVHCTVCQVGIREGPMAVHFFAHFLGSFTNAKRRAIMNPGATETT